MKLSKRMSSLSKVLKFPYLGETMADNNIMKDNEIQQRLIQQIGVVFMRAATTTEQTTIRLHKD